MRFQRFDSKKTPNNPADYARLVDAIEADDAALASELLAVGIHPNGHQDGELSALIWVADQGRLEMVQLLIAAGANVDYENDVGDTPVNCAASIGREDILLALIEAGARLDHPNRFGGKPLDYARDHEPCAKLIVQALEGATRRLAAKSSE